MTSTPSVIRRIWSLFPVVTQPCQPSLSSVQRYHVTTNTWTDLQEEEEEDYSAYYLRSIWTKLKVIIITFFLIYLSQNWFILCRPYDEIEGKKLPTRHHQNCSIAITRAWASSPIQRHLHHQNCSMVITKTAALSSPKLWHLHHQSFSGILTNSAFSSRFHPQFLLKDL